MRSNKTNIFLNTLNTVLLVILFLLGVLFFIITIEDKKDKNEIISYSLEDNKKEKTMFKNELPKVLKEVSFKTNKDEEEDDFSEEDPDLTYAKKLFESSVNSKLKTVFNKPFNYTEDSYCFLEVIMDDNKYDIVSCNSDSIFKREIELGINKMKPFKRKVYNNVNLKNKKVKMKLKID